jgi:hypothetical protein
MDANGGYFQNAWLVDDIDETIGKWVALGTGPFYVFRHAQVQDFHYRGSPAELDFSVALAQAGPIQIEFIQQHDDRPSQYRDSFGPGQSGFHHMCRYTNDFDADLANLADKGIAVAGQGVSGDMKFAYVDTRPTLGFMTEIIEDRASIRDLFEMVSSAAIGWDGRDPIRTLG